VKQLVRFAEKEHCSFEINYYCSKERKKGMEVGKLHISGNRFFGWKYEVMR
jgi:hypothetical protein